MKIQTPGTSFFKRTVPASNKGFTLKEDECKAWVVGRSVGVFQVIKEGQRSGLRERKTFVVTGIEIPVIAEA